MDNIFRGEVYYADLDLSVGSEQNGIRPVVILQNNLGNKFSPTVLIAPITTKINDKKKIPTHIFIKAVDDIKFDSLVLLEQTRVIDKTRLMTYLGRLSNEVMVMIDKALIVALGVNLERLKRENY